MEWVIWVGGVRPRDWVGTQTRKPNPDRHATPPKETNPDRRTQWQHSIDDIIYCGCCCCCRCCCHSHSHEPTFAKFHIPPHFQWNWTSRLVHLSPLQQSISWPKSAVPQYSPFSTQGPSSSTGILLNTPPHTKPNKIAHITTAPWTYKDCCCCDCSVGLLVFWVVGGDLGDDDDDDEAASSFFGGSTFFVVMMRKKGKLQPSESVCLQKSE